MGKEQKGYEHTQGIICYLSHATAHRSLIVRDTICFEMLFSSHDTLTWLRPWSNECTRVPTCVWHILCVMRHNEQLWSWLCVNCSWHVRLVDQLPDHHIVSYIQVEKSWCCNLESCHWASNWWTHVLQTHICVCTSIVFGWMWFYLNARLGVFLNCSSFFEAVLLLNISPLYCLRMYRCTAELII